MEKCVGLVVRTWDWSESSRIAVLWTREFGKVRVLAKGGRRLKSNFECSLDLLSACDFIFIHKSSGGLDLLTEARARENFPHLRTNLQALNSAYYLAELLGDLTQEFDPHPPLYDAALHTLRELGNEGILCGPRLMAFELAFLRELGYGPALEACAVCNGTLEEPRTRDLVFAAGPGGMLCPNCQAGQRGKRTLSAHGWRVLRRMQANADAWTELTDARLRSEIREVLNEYVTYLMGRRPRLLPYLGS